MTIYGYARVSTTGQDLTDQKNQLLQNAASIIYAEKITGAKRAGRNELSNLLEVVQPGDQILVKKIDRLARSIRDLREIVDEIASKGASVKFLDDNMEFNALDKASPIQNMMLNMLGSFAEFERDLIISRTQEGKNYAKKINKDFKEGRPKATITPAKKHAYDLLMSGKSYKEVEQLTGFSKSTLQRIKKKLHEQ